MNYASRMESMGIPNRIQVSQETAKLLRQSGKEHWVVPREDLVDVKGKGCMRTFWLQVFSNGGGSCASKSSEGQDVSEVMECSINPVNGELKRGFSPANKSVRDLNVVETPFKKLSPKELRLVDWNAEILVKMLREIEARRRSKGVSPCSANKLAKLESEYMNKSEMVLAEVREIIRLPNFEHEKKMCDPSRIQIDKDVIDQLRDYILSIASMYHSNNPFHNFVSHDNLSSSRCL